MTRKNKTKIETDFPRLTNKSLEILSLERDCSKCCSRNTILKAVQGLRLRNLVNYAVESWKCNLNYTSVEPDKMEEGRQENLR